MTQYRNLLENWNKFLTEEKTIEEATEEEVGYLDDILHNLEPKDLSFNNIFGDKMRIVRPMKIKDHMLDTLKQTLRKSGYEPDFTTGLATYHVLNLPGGFDVSGNPKKPSTMILTPEQAQTFTDETWQKEHPDAAQKVQKKQIKIGKLLQKGSRLYDNAHKAWNEKEELNPKDFGVEPDKYNPDDTVNVDKYRKAAEEAQAKERKDLQKLFDVFQDYKSSASSALNMFKQLADWWNKKSAFYRENPDDAAMVNSPYSIIYTRHPIDVMRMSDFDNIESCHSPPSREGGDSSYYKCAVAEAHGHGPVAYVVRNEDLNDLVDTYELEDIDHQGLLDALEENDEEIFQDRERGTGELTPLSRVRLKKFVNPKMEISLAVPSTMIYGKRFPELYQNISDFTKDKQQKELKQIEDSRDTKDPDNSAFEDGKFNLGDWERFGGSYQDAGDYPGEVIPTWLGYKTTGRTHYDNTTEDNLELYNVQEQWQEEVNEIRDSFNRRMAAIRITRADVEDDGAGEYYIAVQAVFKLVMDEDDFVTSAFQDKTRKALESIPQYLIDYGYDWLEDRLDYSTLNPRSQDWADLIRSASESIESKIVMEIPIDIEEANPEGGGYAYNPDNFQETCLILDEADDSADAIEELARGVLKREGVLKGGGLFQLAQAIDDESWYEWDYDVDDEYNPTDIALETTTYVNFEDLIKQIPITFDRPNPQSQEVFIEFAGDPLALASQTHGGEDYSFKGWEVRSPEFDTEMMGGFMSLEAVKEYAQWNVALLIMRPKGSKIPKGLESSRDYLIAMKELMRDAAGGKENEFMFPNTQMWVNGPDSDDEYKMMYRMELNEDTPDDASESALKIITETDDEDLLKKMFRMAFAKVAKIPGGKATTTEVKQHFKKFDFF